MLIPPTVAAVQIRERSTDMSREGTGKSNAGQNTETLVWTAEITRETTAREQHRHCN